MFESVHLLAAAAPEGGNLLTDITHQFGVNWQLFISQLIAFCILAWALSKFAYNPVINVLEQRKKRIAEGLENAEKIKTELANAQSKSQEILRDAGTQANKLIEEARAAAAKVQESESQKAVKAAEEIISKARQAAEADRDRMMAELKREIGHLAVKAAMQVTGKMLTAEDQQRLAEETNKQLAA
jgi:F-type H+-transporting ATPase subunit b